MQNFYEKYGLPQQQAFDYAKGGCF